jgi:antibiotic biosynthesis monooxygenase (ABM) superfamily enzyme
LVHLHVTFTVRAHHCSRYEELFRTLFLPILARHGFRSLGIWRTMVGDAGRYVEIWEFDSVEDYADKWRAMSRDPETASVLQQTGPLVENETFSLLEPTGLLVP